jgi:hypothetical protein
MSFWSYLVLATAVVGVAFAAGLLVALRFGHTAGGVTAGVIFGFYAFLVKASGYDLPGLVRNLRRILSR